MAKEMRELMVLFCNMCDGWTIHFRPQHKHNDKFKCKFCEEVYEGKHLRTDWMKENVKSVKFSFGFKGA